MTPLPLTDLSAALNARTPMFPRSMELGSAGNPARFGPGVGTPSVFPHPARGDNVDSVAKERR